MKSPPLSFDVTPISQTKACPQKLRVSCDGCNLSKIKCTKEKPNCVRCLDHDEKCNYSSSRRTGKAKHPSEVDFGRSADTDESDLRGAPPLPVVGNAPLSTRTSSWNMDPRNINFEVGLRITEDPSIPWQDIFPAIGSADQILGSSPKQRHSFTHSTMPTMTDTTNHCLINRYISDRCLPTSVTFSVQRVTDSRSTVFSRDSPSRANIPNRQTQLLPASTQLDCNSLHPSHIETDILSPIFNYLEPLCTCTASTIETLSSLHTATIHPLSFPQTLSTNNAAITNLSQQLSCSCPLDFPSILLIAGTITKFLSTYQTIASTLAPATPSRATTLKQQ